jgi:transcriptional regulator with XRE-family HTH domain
MTLTEAIKTLRKISGLNQQFYATHLGLSTKSLYQYEHGKTPEPKQLVALAADAARRGRSDLYAVIWKAFTDEIVPPPGFAIEIRLTALDESKSPLRKKGKS